MPGYPNGVFQNGGIGKLNKLLDLHFVSKQGFWSVVSV